MLRSVDITPRSATQVISSRQVFRLKFWHLAMRAAGPTNLILLYLITLLIYAEDRDREIH
jgi:hypothetical protein